LMVGSYEITECKLTAAMYNHVYYIENRKTFIY